MNEWTCPFKPLFYLRILIGYFQKNSATVSFTSLLLKCLSFWHRRDALPLFMQHFNLINHQCDIQSLYYFHHIHCENLYSATSREGYPEALPIPTPLNKTILSCQEECMRKHSLSEYLPFRWCNIYVQLQHRHQSWGLGVATPRFWSGGRGVSMKYYYIL